MENYVSIKNNLVCEWFSSDESPVELLKGPIPDQTVSNSLEWDLGTAYVLYSLQAIVMHSPSWEPPIQTHIHITYRY